MAVSHVEDLTLALALSRPQPSSDRACVALIFFESPLGKVTKNQADAPLCFQIFALKECRDIGLFDLHRLPNRLQLIKQLRHVS